MEKKKRALIQVILGGLVGGAVGFGMGKFAFQLFPKDLLKHVLQSSAGPAETTAKLILGLVALWAALAIHELGHLLTGLVQGFRFHLYVAGFLGIRRNTQTDRVDWYLNRDAQLFGGVAATLPTQQTTDLRQRFAWVVLAGPLTSLLTGALVLWFIYMGIGHPAVSTSVLLRCSLIFGLVFSITSLALFLATTVPNRTGVFYTDRARFFRLIRGGHIGQVEQAVLETLAHSMSGRPYRELDSEQLDLLLTEKETFFQTYAHTLAYYRHLDRNELAEAYRHICTANDLAHEQPRLFRQEIWKELAFAHAYIGHDAIQARQVWKQIKPDPEMKPSVQTCLVKAAIALADLTLETAMQDIQQGILRLPTPIYKAEDRLYAQLLDQLLLAVKRPI
ncbi:site-2 protease family protein [Spirosoma sp.]|uniref:site-2 protease family protein n=1 Tax=Spirosoma sp. TaxID=1899569 RepID=UPI002625C6B5|nr:site-2 protease family protein [Spirosoma sp.]MCX6219052.1 site-2 protease family protein [Spirosoma sp.]